MDDVATQAYDVETDSEIISNDSYSATPTRVVPIDGANRRTSYVANRAGFDPAKLSKINIVPAANPTPNKFDLATQAFPDFDSPIVPTLTKVQMHTDDMATQAFPDFGEYQNPDDVKFIATRHLGVNYTPTQAFPVSSAIKYTTPQVFRSDDIATQAYPCDTATQAYPTDKATQAYPADMATQAYPADMATQPYPVDMATQAYPADMATQAYPVDIAMEAYPADMATQAYPDVARQLSTLPKSRLQNSDNDATQVFPEDFETNVNKTNSSEFETQVLPVTDECKAPTASFSTPRLQSSTDDIATQAFEPISPVHTHFPEMNFAAKISNYPIATPTTASTAVSRAKRRTRGNSVRVCSEQVVPARNSVDGNITLNRADKSAVDINIETLMRADEFEDSCEVSILRKVDRIVDTLQSDAKVLEILPGGRTPVAFPSRGDAVMMKSDVNKRDREQCASSEDKLGVASGSKEVNRVQLKEDAGGSGTPMFKVEKIIRPLTKRRGRKLVDTVIDKTASNEGGSNVTDPDEGVSNSVTAKKSRGAVDVKSSSRKHADEPKVLDVGIPVKEGSKISKRKGLSSKAAKAAELSVETVISPETDGGLSSSNKEDKEDTVKSKKSKPNKDFDVESKNLNRTSKNGKKLNKGLGKSETCSSGEASSSLSTNPGSSIDDSEGSVQPLTRRVSMRQNKGNKLADVDFVDLEKKRRDPAVSRLKLDANDEPNDAGANSGASERRKVSTKPIGVLPVTTEGI